MTKILKILLILSIFSVVSGPVFVFSVLIPGVNIYLSDIVIFLIGIIWLINFKSLKRLIFPDSITKYFFFFAGISLLSLILSPLKLSFNEIIISLLYLIRFLMYFSLYPTIVYLIKSKALTKEKVFDLLIVSGFLLSVFGWLQYFLYPDLRNLYYLGWDPHYKRIFGTQLDPNYLGLFLVMTFVLFLRKKSSVINWILRSFLFITLLFTYSRSSYLALIAAIIGFAWMKRKFTVLLAIVIFFLIFIPLLPRGPGESVRLERMFSVTERIRNLREGLNLFSRYPLLGVGFNTIRFAKSDFGVVQDNLIESHSGAGFDNSFIFIAVTTGIIGLISYLMLLGSVYKKLEVTGKVMFLAVITHSLFVNSLFLPWIMIWWWIILGIKG